MNSTVQFNAWITLLNFRLDRKNSFIAHTIKILLSFSLIKIVLLWAKIKKESFHYLLLQLLFMIYIESLSKPSNLFILILLLLLLIIFIILNLL